jgi:cation transport ATPase
MKTKIILFLSCIVFLAACSSEKNFTSRHYNKGKYASHQGKVKPVKENEFTQPEIKNQSVTATIETAEKSVSKGENVLELNKESESETYSQNQNSKTETSKKFAIKRMSSKELFSSIKQLKKEIKEDKKEFAKSHPKGTKKQTEGGVSTKAILGFIFGILGVVADVVAWGIIVGSSEYVFAIMFLFGLVFGILGLIFGLGGVSDYKKGDKNPMSLIFGIIGAVLGVSAMILAIYYSISSLILAID